MILSFVGVTINVCSRVGLDLCLMTWIYSHCPINTATLNNLVLVTWISSINKLKWRQYILLKFWSKRIKIRSVGFVFRQWWNFLVLDTLLIYFVHSFNFKTICFWWPLVLLAWRIWRKAIVFKLTIVIACWEIIFLLKQTIVT